MAIAILSPTKFSSEVSFPANWRISSSALLSSHSYRSDESYYLEGKIVEFVVSFKGRGSVIAGIRIAKWLHGVTESDDGGALCSVHAEDQILFERMVVLQENKFPDQERAKIIFKMKDGSLLVSFVGSDEREGAMKIESLFKSACPRRRDTTCT